ncbi:MAG: FAD-binding oxidoreductase [Candidatus Dadabacteria bacterium]|nr:FAD-binding oxidoreductase [Candidatus Dadabacteria bacterium]
MNSPLEEIINIVGREYTLSLPDELEHYEVDTKKPSLVVFPGTTEEISGIMKIASSATLSITPWGGGTKIGFGREPSKVDIIVCTGRLNRILEHEAGDLVATAECGTQLKVFQGVVKGKNQFLAIDPPHEESGATLGGIIATNDSGPRRLRFGTMRESLIGIKFVRSDGYIVRGGGKVVKNVAGYDLPKLYVGSFGTLGLIVEATFRLYPMPESSETCLVSFPTLETSQELVLSILNSPLIPTCLEVLNQRPLSAISDKLNLNLKKDWYAIAVRIEGIEKAVKEQISKLKLVSGDSKGEGILLKGDFEEKLWQEIREFPWRISEKNRTICKAGVLIADLAVVLRALDDLEKESGLKVYVSGQGGTGVLIIAIEGEILSIVKALKSIRALVNSLKGTMVIKEAPSSIKSQVDVWGEIGTSHKMMERLRSLLDPYRVLNPGRFV